MSKQQDELVEIEIVSAGPIGLGGNNYIAGDKLKVAANVAQGFFSTGAAKLVEPPAETPDAVQSADATKKDAKK